MSKKTRSDDVQEQPEREQTPPPQQENQVVVDESGLLPTYSNFCRVTATPEEVIVDSGLNPQPFAEGRQDVKANHRIVMSFYTTKRLLSALGITIQRHEQTFGTIELDVRRRAAGAGLRLKHPRPRLPWAANRCSSSSARVRQESRQGSSRPVVDSKSNPSDS